MKNLIENLPEKINITVNKQDLLEFANYILYRTTSNEVKVKSEKSILKTDEAAKFIGSS